MSVQMRLNPLLQPAPLCIYLIVNALTQFYEPLESVYFDVLTSAAIVVVFQSIWSQNQQLIIACKQFVSKPICEYNDGLNYSVFLVSGNYTYYGK
jgi:hypothetical protein